MAGLRSALEHGRGFWEVTGAKPSFYLTGSFPDGWNLLRLSASADTEKPIHLRIDYGRGLSHDCAVSLGNFGRERRTHRVLVRFWLAPRALSLEPTMSSGVFFLDDVRMTRPSDLGLFLRTARNYLSIKGGVSWTLALEGLRSTHDRFRRGGWKAVHEAIAYQIRERVLSRQEKPYPARNRGRTRDEVRRNYSVIESLEYQPTISLLMYVCDVDARWLDGAMESARAQHYPYWELVIAAENSIHAELGRVLSDHAEVEPRIKLIFGSFQGNAPLALIAALEITEGDFVGLFDQADELTPDALYRNAVLLNSYPEADIVYSDGHGVTATGNQKDKPDWSPDAFPNSAQMGNLTIYRKDLVSKVGGFRLGFEGKNAQRDLVSRLIEHASQIRHIPKVLCHKRVTVQGVSGDAVGESVDGARAQALSFKVTDLPVASFIIVTFNKLGHTTRCLDSLARMETDIPYEIVVVDNGSTDDTPRFLKEDVHGIRILLNEDNRHFAEGCNQGAEIARGKHLVFLNNDTVVAPALLDNLVAAAESAEDVGAVGAKLLLGDGPLQEAGSILWSNGTALGYGRGDDPGKAEYMFRREVDYASAACLLVKQEAFSSVGGFETLYRPAYYEDADLCMKIRKAGYVVLFDPFSEVTHFEYGTAGRQQAVQWMIQNQKKFVERWNDELRHQPRPEPHNRLSVLRARSRRCTGFLCVFDDRLPAFDQGAGYPRMYHFLSCLKKLGYHITFTYDVKTGADGNYVETMRRLGVEVLEEENSRQWLKTSGGFFDVVVMSRPRVFNEHYRSVRAHAPQAKVLYDSEALWYKRIQLETELDPYPLVSYPGAPRKENLIKEASDFREVEYRAIRAADAIVAVSRDEADEMARVNPDASLFEIPTFHDGLRFGPEVRDFERRHDLLLVGGFFNDMRSPNVDAVLYFLMEIFPRVRKELPDVKLNVAGNQPPEILRQLVGEDVRLWGDLRVTDLRALYFQARVGVVPQRFGSGMKYKVTEAMSLGLPLVVSTVGAQGTKLIDGKSAFITDDPAVFAGRVVELYTNRIVWHELAKCSFDIAMGTYSKEAVEPKIEEMMKMVMS